MIDTLFLTTMIVLVVLKLAGLVSWSWWWVLSPAFAWLAMTVISTAAIFALGAYHNAKRRR